jgi:hypothetical protein
MDDQQNEDQAAFRREDEIDTQDEVTDTELYQGEADSSAEGALESLTETDLRAGETADPNVAAEEGMTWVPPIDPPVVPSDDAEGLRVAAGFGDSAIAEPFDHDHPSAAIADEDELSARVREALRADATTSQYADSLAIATRDRTVALRGVVDDIVDSDNVVAVASRVGGIDEVVDELEIRALEES